MAEKEQHYRLMDYVRLFLAAEVVWLHLGSRLLHETRPMYSPIVPVPGFVAISGFLILRSWESSIRSGGPLEFWRRRALRILPAFVASLLLVAALFGFPSIVDCLKTWATLGVAKSHNGPLWSLSAEELLYLGLSLTLIVGGLRSAWSVALAAGVSLVLHSILAPLLFAQGIVGLAKLLGIVPSFLIGAWCCREPRVLERLRPYTAPIVGVAVVLSYFALFMSTVNAPASLFGAFAVLLVGTMPVKAWRIPDTSYGLYVYHVPILNKLTALGVGGWQFVVVGAVTSIGAAIFSTIAVEGPFRALRNSTLAAKHARLMPTPAATGIAEGDSHIGKPDSDDTRGLVSRVSDPAPKIGSVHLSPSQAQAE